MTISDSSLSIAPQRSATGVVILPGSKSISNRVLLVAALAQGTTSLSGLLESDDTHVMLAALQHMGVAVDLGPDDTAVITGGTPFSHRHGDLFLGNAGTAFRSLTAVLALMGGDFRLSGVNRMHERPIGDLVDALRCMGARIDYLGNPGYPPLHIVTGQIQTNTPVKVKANVSSQFLTALLLAAPLAAAGSESDVVIEVDGDLISLPYILITLKIMASFGVQVRQEGLQRFVVPAGSRYISPGQFHIEGDASTASYFMALGAIGGGPIHIEGAGASSIQGDMAFADVVSDMGATVIKHERSVEVRGVRVADGERLKAFDKDFNLIPDAAMTAAAMALYADGPCTLRNIASWRVKETDRIHAMHTELEKLGAKVESGPDWMRVYPIPEGGWKTADIATYDDHRMAMCFSLAAFGTVPITILDPECVSKTFPGYFSAFQQLVME